MRIIGRLAIGAPEARGFMGRADRTETVLQGSQWQPFVQTKPQVGDLFWVQEPFIEYIDTKYGSDEIRYGTLSNKSGSRPEWVRKRRPNEYRVKPRSAGEMKRYHSRMTIEVIGLVGDVLEICVHRRNVDRIVSPDADIRGTVA